MTGDMDGEKSIEIIEQTNTNSGNGIPNMDYIIKAYRILCSKKTVLYAITTAVIFVMLL